MVNGDSGGDKMIELTKCPEVPWRRAVNWISGLGGSSREGVIRKPKR